MKINKYIQQKKRKKRICPQYIGIQKNKKKLKKLKYIFKLCFNI